MEKNDYMFYTAEQGSLGSHPFQNRQALARPIVPRCDPLQSGKCSKICQLRNRKSSQVCGARNGRCSWPCNFVVSDRSRATWRDFCRVSTMYCTLAAHPLQCLPCPTFAGYSPSNRRAVRSMAAMVVEATKRRPCSKSSISRVGNELKEFLLC